MGSTMRQRSSEQWLLVVVVIVVSGLDGGKGGGDEREAYHRGQRIWGATRVSLAKSHAISMSKAGGNNRL